MKAKHLSRTQLLCRLSHAWGRFCKDERGQSTTEYILILSVVVMIAMKFKEQFSKRLLSTVEKLGNDIDEVVKE
jgi:Flp pilus assembly pilin Flp